MTLYFPILRIINQTVYHLIEEKKGQNHCIGRGGLLHRYKTIGNSMAASYRGFISEDQIATTLPLLMDHNNASSSNSDHTINVVVSHDNRNNESNLSDLLSSSIESEEVSLDLHAINEQSGQILVVGPPPPPPPPLPVAGRMASIGRRNVSANYEMPQRTSPLNSGLWISIELIVTVCQIIAAVIVLSLSRDEKPHTPLSVWVLGHASGCLAILPLLYWRYTYRNVRQESGHNPTLQPLPQHEEDTEHGVSSQTGIRNSIRNRLRLGVCMERFKITLDCFFAVWFVVGNVWVFGGHSSSSEAPILYRLCIVFLTLSCIGYAMPFLLCATICCCLPCIIRIVGAGDGQGQTRGAPLHLIHALPKCRFKTKSKKGSSSNRKDDSETEGGFVFAGTDKERAVSADDAVCCICLGKYINGAELREVPCAHLFHVECVDKWLKINASCPLCKKQIASAPFIEEAV